jgi:hypothetical protein
MGRKEKGMEGNGKEGKKEREGKGKANRWKRFVPLPRKLVKRIGSRARKS